MTKLFTFIFSLFLLYTSLVISQENNSLLSAVPSNPHLVIPTFELMRVGARDSSKFFRLINQLPPGETDPTKGSIHDFKPNSIEIFSPEFRYCINYEINIVALNSKGDTLLTDISNFLNLRIYPEFTPENDKITDIIIPIISTARVGYSIKDTVLIEFTNKSISPFFDINNKFKVYKPDISITNHKFSERIIQTGIHPEKGMIVINNTTFEKDNLVASDVVIHSIEIDSSAPNYGQFSNYIVEETGQSIYEIKDYILEPYEELTITFDFNTNNTQLGQQFARLKVISDAGEMTMNGKIPTTENNYSVDFDGKFTDSNPSGLDDGGYIEANLLFDPQSSINNSDIVNQFEAKILSENPTSNNSLGISVTSKSMNKYDISITDINGRVVKELGESMISGEKEFIYDISDLNSGVYFMNITDGSINRILELVVVR
ncbi:MAG: T9SS type A sorting domain-containing protein [Candidatus Kapaibacterium sp.]